MSIEALYPLMTEAIRRAETLEDLRAPGACSAYLDVSLFEEKVAEVLPVSLAEGRIARRGAVRAALKARDYARAEELTQRYLAEAEAPEALELALRQMLEEDARTLTDRFRYAAKHHAAPEARDVARRLQQGGAFGLAA